MRVVFDSNVWIAALVASGSSKDLVVEALAFCEVFVSPYILEEVDRILDKKIGATAGERLQALRWMKGVCETVDPSPREGLSCRDRKDLPILWLALFVHADFLVTGDHDLTSLKEFQGTRIIPPALFWRSL